MKIPIAANYKGRKLETISLKKPTSGVLADTRKAVDAGDPYKALQVFISGCTESVEDITDKGEIRAITATLPYKSAEFLVTQIALLNHEDDGIEGVYNCPRCGKQKVCEKNSEGDTRDRLSALPVIETNNLFTVVSFQNPVQLHSVEGEMGSTVSSIALTYPTLGNCSTAFSKVGDKDSMRLQFAIYTEALLGVNDTEVDAKFKSRFGLVLFDRLTIPDLKKVAEVLDSVGLDTKVSKTCTGCGKLFSVVLNSFDFFALSLQ
jgi:hypothetical protein